MKFTCSIDINKPKEELARLFADPSLLHHYQEGFKEKKLLEGNEGDAGAISMMYYGEGKRQMELEETILLNKLPDEFKGQYHHKHMDNTMHVRFTSIDEHSTRYSSDIHYTAFRGFVPTVMGTLFPFIFKSQVKKWMKNFKQYVESV